VGSSACRWVLQKLQYQHRGNLRRNLRAENEEPDGLPKRCDFDFEQRSGTGHPEYRRKDLWSGIDGQKDGRKTQWLDKLYLLQIVDAYLFFRDWRANQRGKLLSQQFRPAPRY